MQGNGKQIFTGVHTLNLVNEIEALTHTYSRVDSQGGKFIYNSDMPNYLSCNKTLKDTVIPDLVNQGTDGTDMVFIIDEAHLAKDLILDIRHKLPKAKIILSTATPNTLLSADKQSLSLSVTKEFTDKDHKAQDIQSSNENVKIKVIPNKCGTKSKVTRSVSEKLAAKVEVSVAQAIKINAIGPIDAYQSDKTDVKEFITDLFPTSPKAQKYVGDNLLIKIPKDYKNRKNVSLKDNYCRKN